MPRRSAGLLLHRSGAAGAEVLIVHPGGPLWRHRDAGAWSLPKGEVGPGEDPLAVARREFHEELGCPAPDGAEPVLLGDVRQAGGKVVRGWALRGDLALDRVRSNTFELEWPPRSGRIREFPEVDRAAWVDLDSARQRLGAAQAQFLDRLVRWLAGGDPLGDVRP